MIIVLKRESKGTSEEIRHRLMAGGFQFNVLEGVKYTVIPVVGDLTSSDINRFRSVPGVEKVLRISMPYYMVTKEYRQRTVIDLGDGVKIGDGFQFIAGPSSVESEESFDRIASFLSGLGVKLIRGGTYKMRSSPYSFEGLGDEGLQIMRTVANRYGLKTVSEIVDLRSLDHFLEQVDVIQVGARNMYNFPLLREIGRSGKPVLLKRAPAARMEDLLLSAEHIMLEGNENIILCERGSLSFDEVTRSAVNIAAVPVMKDLSHLPVLLDPSHGVGVARYIPAVSEAAPLLGADGLLIEVHFDPSNAISDGFQSLSFEEFSRLHGRIGKTLSCLSCSSC
ncbi:MAG TPA: 3-deoxy-7-phosphoheptulonate synthase [bacterium]|nr:3-deoxy-7-phosphoheptulonate synthase [bacterium]